jgi:hypothetical protein
MSEKPTKTVTLSKDKDTKHTRVFKETGDNPVIGTIYVPKTTLASLGNEGAQQIQVTIQLP